ncbi:hypothetical protein LHYA1_G004817 [Lachnellula hyalina]|uniref:Uncharacterized protein n=1 Tax=Lachnellula hyalina TaxID=1316788 RepID=A0A8H8R4P7_9HELO|nr:uncharacterized protein LHYA1_G004817 [Lachnellula hyalina]TVY26824.1 hypothetical protein LHYA1_G004817 [Lachnellula hyalina]
MSDEELDREWQPSSVRPQSTMARSFSLALNDLFKIDNSLADLDAAVYENLTRKKAVSTQTTELEALEARLKATEERLKARGASPLPNEKVPSGRSSPRQRAPLAADTFTDTKPEDRAPTSPLSSQPPATGSRPQTANRPKTGNRGDSGALPPMPGALPPTPGASEGELSSSESEYVLVKGRTDHSGVQDGDDAAQQ